MAKVARRVKRTYNLRPATVDTVRRLVEAQVAPTQDALVERAVRDLARAFRDDLHSRLWAQAGQDPEFQAEMQEIWDGLEADDRLAWGAGAA
jgi:hypothetical protein